MSPAAASCLPILAHQQHHIAAQGEPVLCLPLDTQALALSLSTVIFTGNICIILLNSSRAL